jgi:type II secretory pathway pseudopilin PulG
MAALLVGISVMSVLLSMAMPVWSQFAKREREEELIWRGQQYARAIGLFQRKYANTFPPNVDILVEQRFLRKKYKDPITGEDFQMIPAAGAMRPGGAQPPGGLFPDGGLQGQQAPGGAPGRGFQPAAGGSQGGAVPVQPGIQPGLQSGISTDSPNSGGGQFVQPSIGIQGVVSKSTQQSIKAFNGRTKYNEWLFINMASAQQITPGRQLQPGQQQPGGGLTQPRGTNRRPGASDQFPGQQSPFGTPGQPLPAQPPSRPPGN